VDTVVVADEKGLESLAVPATGGVEHIRVVAGHRDGIVADP
jgi:hypothetical protein